MDTIALIFSRKFLAMIEHMAQVVIDLSKVNNKKFLEIMKAGGRYDPQTYEKREYAVKSLEIGTV